MSVTSKPLGIACALVALAGCASVLDFADFRAGRAVEPEAEAGVPDDLEEANADVYVSPAGDDAAAGTRERPVRSVRRALELVGSAAGAGVTQRIAVCAGTYREGALDVRGPIELRGDYDCTAWLRTKTRDTEAVGPSGADSRSVLENAEPGASFLSMSESERPGAAPLSPTGVGPRLERFKVNAAAVGVAIFGRGGITVEGVTLSSDLSAAGGVAVVVQGLSGAGIFVLGAAAERPVRISNSSLTVRGASPDDPDADLGGDAFVAGIVLSDASAVVRRNVVEVTLGEGSAAALASEGSTLAVDENSLFVSLRAATIEDGAMAGQRHVMSEVRSVRNVTSFEALGHTLGLSEPRVAVEVVGVFLPTSNDASGAFTSDGDRIVGPTATNPSAPSPVRFLGFFDQSSAIRSIVNASIYLDARNLALTRSSVFRFGLPTSALLAHNTVRWVPSSAEVRGDAGSDLYGISFTLGAIDTAPSALAVEANLFVCDVAELTLVHGACDTTSFARFADNRVAGAAIGVRGRACATTDIEGMIPGAGDAGTRAFACPDGGCADLLEAKTGREVARLGLRLVPQVASCADLQVAGVAAVTVDGAGVARPDGGATVGAFEVGCR